MTPIKPTNLSLDADDLERLERIQGAIGPSKENPAWKKTDTVRQALIALDLGLDEFRQRCEGLVDTPPPDPDQVELYKSLVREMGYEVVLRKPIFGRTPNGGAEVEVDGFRYFLTSSTKLHAYRESVQDGVPYSEVFEVRHGGLRPRSRSGPLPPGQIWTDHAKAREVFGITDSEPSSE